MGLWLFSWRVAISSATADKELTGTACLAMSHHFSDPQK